MSFKRVYLFKKFFNQFIFLLVLRGSFDEALAILQVRLFVGFRHLEGAVGVQLFGLLFSLV